MRFMQIESVLQTKNRTEPAKNWFSVALLKNLFILFECRKVNMAVNILHDHDFF